jgi:tetratricopeptide (TPR) repeat protein
MNISIRKSFLTTVISGCLLIFAMNAEAQIRSIKGKVTNDKDEPIVGALIKFQGQDIYREFSAKTDKRGEYTYLLGIQGGIFRLLVHAQGYKPTYKENVRPEVGETLEENFKLTPGEDYKLPWEMSDAEKAEFLKKNSEIEKQQKMTEGVRSNLKAAQTLMSESKFAEAIVELNKILERLPDQPIFHNAIAECYLRLGKNEEAMASYQKAISFDPKNADYYASLGNVLNTMGKNAEAQEALKKAVEIDPSAKNLYVYGIILMNGMQMPAALDAFKKSIAADANFAESYFQLAMAQSSNQETIPAAIENLKKYKALGKGKPENLAIVDDLIKALGGKP